MILHTLRKAGSSANLSTALLIGCVSFCGSYSTLSSSLSDEALIPSDANFASTPLLTSALLSSDPSITFPGCTPPPAAAADSGTFPGSGFTFSSALGAPGFDFTFSSALGGRRGGTFGVRRPEPPDGRGGRPEVEGRVPVSTCKKKNHEWGPLEANPLPPKNIKCACQGKSLPVYDRLENPQFSVQLFAGV